MKCPLCEFDNREGARFCTRCGNPLILTCPVCHTPAEKDDVYCAVCGTHLPTINAKIAGSFLEQQPSHTPSLTKPATKKEGSTESERKNVSVLFGDISGFTAMSEKLDPEEVTTIMNRCLSMMGNVVVSYEGYIDKFIGDCIMAIFGAPITHENDPELAIRAALEMSKKIDEINKDIPIKLEKPLALHIGINTGLVVAGKMGSDSRMDYTVMGDTVNLASRLESKAIRGQVFVSAYTHNRTKNLFEFIEHEPVAVKGKKDPVSVYQVVRALEDSEIHGTTSVEIPLVGRKHELTTLSDCADRLFNKEGQAVFLISDPGFGKSRVQVELKKRFSTGEVQFIEGRCHSYGKNTPYHTFIDLFRQLCAVDSDDMPETVGKKIEEGLPLLVGEDRDVLSDEAEKALVLIGKLLGTDLSEQYNVFLQEMSAQEVSTATIRSIKWVFEAMSKRKAVVISLEDLHNADTASVEVIAALIGSAKEHPIMLLLLLRPDKNVPSSKLKPLSRRVLGDRAIEVVFDSLTRTESEAFVKYFLDAKEVPRELLELIGSRSSGNPLFLQEIVRSLVDSGAIEKDENKKVKVVKKIEEISIPSSISGLIMARFDQLSADLREMMTKAAVIGPSFKRPLIARLVGEKDLDGKINALIEAEMIFESRSFPDLEYSFHTSFIQETIYETLLLKRRRSLHLEVAAAIKDLYKEKLSEQTEALAYHYTEGNDIEKAYRFTVRSGLKTKDSFANETAALFLQQAIGLAKKLKEPKPELTSVYRAYSEVLELLGDMDGAIKAWKNIIKLDDNPLAKADGMRNIGRINEKRGSKESAIKIYEEALDLIKAHRESIEYALLQMNLSWVLNRFRRTEEAVTMADEALKVFEEQGVKEHIALCCNNLAVFYENLEEYDKALEYNTKSLEIFKELKHRRQIGNVELSLGYLLTKRGEMDQALEHFTKSADAMDRIGNRVGSATALLAKGRSYADVGRFDEAEIALLSALRSFKDLSMDRKVVATLVSLAGVLLDMKNSKEAMAHIEDGKESAKANDFQSDLGKLARLTGRAYRQEGKDEKSEKAYEEAFKIFTDLKRERDAKSVEREWKS